MKEIRNPIRMPHDVICVNCAWTALALGGLLVYGLVFPKGRIHLTKHRGIHIHQKANQGMWIHSNKVAPLGRTL
jgi:hypothetical protein